MRLSFPAPVRDVSAEAGGAPLDGLPEWDLTDLYAGQDATELKRDLDWSEEACRSFATDYEAN